MNTFTIKLACIWILGIFSSNSSFAEDIIFKAKQEKPLVVMVASYKNSKWYKQNLDSIFGQKYKNYRVIYVDDCSPDDTGALVEAYVKEQKQEHRFTLIKNEKRIGSLANKYKIAHLCAPNEVIIDLDGDDWLFDDSVFNEINKHYKDPNVWVTYGGFTYTTGGSGFGSPIEWNIIANNSYRDEMFGTGTIPLRTFYAGLFHNIELDNLVYNGDFFQTSGDLAFMFPILEMAGFHSRFTSKIMYVYNIQTGLNDSTVNSERQSQMDKIIRSKTKHLPFKSTKDFM